MEVQVSIETHRTSQLEDSRLALKLQTCHPLLSLEGLSIPVAKRWMLNALIYEVVRVSTKRPWNTAMNYLKIYLIGPLVTWRHLKIPQSNAYVCCMLLFQLSFTKILLNKYYYGEKVDNE
jgi:hypothetical protein